MTKEKLLDTILKATVEYIINYITYEEYYKTIDDISDYRVTLSFTEYQKSSTKLDTYWDSFKIAYGDIKTQDKENLNTIAIQKAVEYFSLKNKQDLWDEYQENVLSKRHFDI